MSAWDAIDLRRLRRDDPALDALWTGSAAMPGSGRSSVEQEDVCPVVTLPGGGDWEAYLATLDKKARHEIRRKLRRAEAVGPVEFRALPLDAASVESFIALHQARWGAQGLFSDTPDGDRSRRFLHRLTSLEAAEGERAQLLLGDVSVGDQVVFSTASFDDGRTCYFYNAGMDPAARELSPGVTGTAAFLRDRLEAGRPALRLPARRRAVQVRVGRRRRAHRAHRRQTLMGDRWAMQATPAATSRTCSRCPTGNASGWSSWSRRAPTGGAQEHVHALLSRLDRERHDVRVIALSDGSAVRRWRSLDVWDLEPEIAEPSAGTRPPRAGVGGHVEFRNVTFQYPGAEEPALTGVSFTAHPGEVTAIVGGTGSGKSTLAGLIPRFYDAIDGQVLLDGIDVRHIAQGDLRARIGFVPQTAVLFTGTVAANIRYGREDASDDEVRHAATVAQAIDFVEAMPEQFASSISQGGINLSGGQKQRLSIARAIVRRPDVYVFDDSFSALDFTTDARLRAALREETAHAAVFIVAQRISTVITADRIVVLDEGRVVGIGTHAELIKSNEIYREIVASQVSLDEVA